MDNLTYESDLMRDLQSLEFAEKYLRAALADSPEAFNIAVRDFAKAQKTTIRATTTFTVTTKEPITSA